jgi:hypothetical protein
MLFHSLNLKIYERLCEHDLVLNTQIVQRTKEISFCSSEWWQIDKTQIRYSVITIENNTHIRIGGVVFFHKKVVREVLVYEYTKERPEGSERRKQHTGYSAQSTPDNGTVSMKPLSRSMLGEYQRKVAECRGDGAVGF